MSKVIPLDAIMYQVGAMTEPADIIESDCTPLACAYQTAYDQNNNGVYEPVEMEQRTRQWLMSTMSGGIWGQYSWESYFMEWLAEGKLPPVCIDDEHYHRNLDNLRPAEDGQNFWRFYRQEIDYSGVIAPSAQYATWGLPSQKYITDGEYRALHPITPYTASIRKDGFIHVNCYIGIDPNTGTGNFPWIRTVIENCVPMLEEDNRSDIDFIVWLQPFYLDTGEAQSVDDLVSVADWKKMLEAVFSVSPAARERIKGVACWMQWRADNEWQQRLQDYLNYLSATCVEASA